MQFLWNPTISWIGLEKLQTIDALSSIVQLVMKISASMKKSVEKGKEDKVYFSIINYIGDLVKIGINNKFCLH